MTKKTKNSLRKSLSVALALVLCIQMIFGCAGIAFAAEGDVTLPEAVLDFSFAEEDAVLDAEGNTIGINGIAKTANGEATVTADAIGITFENGVAVFPDDDFNRNLRDQRGIKFAPNEEQDPLKVLPDGSGVTVSMWIKTSKTVARDVCSSLFVYGHKQGNGQLGATAQLLEVPSATNCVYYRDNGGNSNNYKFGTSGNVYMTDTWQMVTLVDSGTGTVTLYVDGVQVGSRSENKASKSISYLAHDGYGPDTYYFGYVDYLDAGSSDAHFGGEMDSIAIYGEAMTAAQVSELYEAHFMGNDYTLTLNANRGTCEPSSLTVTYGEAIGELPTPTREGYIFVGWYDANGNEVTAESIYDYPGDTTLSAKWKGEAAVAREWKVSSPNGNIVMTVVLSDVGELSYSVMNSDVEIIGTSPMGMVTNLGDFSNTLSFVAASEVAEVDEAYDVISGKADIYYNHYYEQTLTFENENNPGVEFDVVVRAYDDGAAYRYAIRGTQDGQRLTISDETSGVQLPARADVVWMNYASSTWNYESDYQVTTTEGLSVGATPSIPMLYSKDGVYTLFTESNLDGTYSGSMFTVAENGMMDIEFAKLQTTDIVTTAPFKSPWRVAITGDLEAIVENTLVENLADAPDESYNFEDWVDPGMSSWSWVSFYGGQEDPENHLKWIEFGAEMGWDYYILDEGWQPSADGNRMPYVGMHDWWPQVKQAAADAGVKLWAWVHVSDIDTKEERISRFEEWSKEGIVGIKADFFDGESQAKMQLLNDVYRDAADYNLMVLIHGANKSTGEIRTWPNVYGREAVKGQEAGGITANQYTLIPFIRAAIGPTEVTEQLQSKDYNKTTMGFQIALTALIEDGIHSLGSQPDHYRNVPEAMAYYTNYPDVWEKTKLAGGEIGKYLSIARLAEQDWYVSGISVDARTMEVPMDFLDADTVYTAQLYKENGRRDIDQEIIPNVTKATTLNIDVLQGGGYAVRLIPAGSMDSIDTITAPTALRVAVRSTVTPEVTVAPADAEFQDLVWTSADESIAAVSVSGEITGVAEGTTTVTVASAYDETVKAEIKVTVTPSPYNYVKLEAESGVAQGGAGDVDNGNASGGQHVGNIKGDSATVTFTVNSPVAATTTLELWYGTYSNRDFGVTVNGGAKQVINGSATGDWVIIGDKPLVLTIDLVAGENTIVVGGNTSDAPNLDYIVVAVPKEIVIEPAVLTGESVTGEAGTEVKVPITLSNVASLAEVEGTDGTIAAIQFFVEGAELVGFEASEAFAGLDWSAENGIVMGLNMSFTEPGVIIADLSEDAVIGTLVIKAPETVGDTEIALVLEVICDENGESYNEVVEAESFVITVTEPPKPVVEPAVLKGENVTAEAGTEVKVPVALSNVAALAEVEGTDGTIAAIQFFVEGAELVGFEASEAFAGLDWSVENGTVMGFNMSFTEPGVIIADLGEDAVIGSLIVKAPETAGDTEVTLAVEVICDETSESYNEVVEVEPFTITTTAHEHVAGETVVENEVKATCTDDGSYDNVTYCSACSEELNRETVTVSAAGHDWDDGVVTKEPTTSETGEKTYTCSVCKATKTEVLPVAPSQLFNITSASNDMGNALGLYFYIAKDDLKGTDYYAEIVMDYSDSRPNRVLTYDFSEWDDFDDSEYRVFIGDIAAKEMADEIYVTVYNSDDNTPASNVWVDSMQAYGMRILSKNSNNTYIRTLMVDMLNYGAAAQSFFGYNTGDLANAQLTEIQKGYATKSVTLNDYRTSSGPYDGSMLVYEDNIVLSPYFLNTTPDMYAIVEYTDHFGVSQRFRIEQEDFYVESATSHAVDIETLVVADYRQLVTCTIYKGDNTVYASVVDSMESYSYRMRDRDPLFEMAAKFSSSAYSYLHRNG